MENEASRLETKRWRDRFFDYETLRYLKTNEGLLLVLGAFCVIPTFVFCGFYWFYLSTISSDPADWGYFGDYLSGTVGILLSAATLAVVVYASAVIPQAFEANRRKEEQQKLAVELARSFYDRNFYIDIIAPSWEIAVKWLCWEGEDGAKYKHEVCAGQIQTNLKQFHSVHEARKAPYLSPVRFEPHFTPYGFRHGKQANNGHCIKELSEHQVLNLWLQFWVDLHTLLECELVDKQTVQQLFSDWYDFWLEFMLQLRFAEQEFYNEVRKDYHFKQEQHRHLTELEKILFSTPDAKLKYEKTKSAAEETGRAIGLAARNSYAENSRLTMLVHDQCLKPSESNPLILLGSSIAAYFIFRLIKK